VVSGIGFLGGGAIIVQRGTVRGLTTAAGIWFVAAIGLACGAGLYSVALIGTVLAVLILVPFKTVERRGFQRTRVVLELRLARATNQISEIQSLIEDAGSTVRTLRVTDIDKQRSRVLLELESPHGHDVGRLIDSLELLTGIDRITVRNL